MEQPEEPKQFENGPAPGILPLSPETLSSEKADRKCVLVIDQELPLGVIANTAAVLALSLGRQHPEIIGPDLPDREGSSHLGITTLPVPILKGTKSSLLALREKLRVCQSDLTVVDVINATSTTRNYDEYAQVLVTTPTSELAYHGIALMGSKKLVNRFTGNLGLLR
ncbi:DUF2000 domain-containing protein [Kiloniella laminariae]|uniref:DUF2000 domain-containing protein n=1 Tax=Kiloniella laminariae TaxID=454162 RepID=A0ABT4LEE4_9PROT|nr:DUF2000 domain-containing protein [Kiloniella laminariae]MCZ4279468.1 DUF2000 domain-containing protein [Kiloniella laminariae]